MTSTPPFPCLEEAKVDSPGQRPGFGSQTAPALKGRDVLRRILLAILWVCVATKAEAIMGESYQDVGLQPDGSILLQTWQQITLKFEIRDSKAVNFKVVPSWPRQPDTIHFWIRRTGEARSKLHTSNHIADELGVFVPMPGTISYRFTFSSADSPKPLRGGSSGHSFNGPVKDVKIFDVEFKLR
jgi:hypothetical protein